MASMRTLLIGANCLWAVLLPIVMIWPLEVPRTIPVSPEDLAQSAAAGARKPDVSSDLETVAALFDRPVRPERPLSTAPASPPVPSMVNSPLRLIGLIDVASDRIALIQAGKPAQVIRVREGDRLEGWAVAAIRPRSVQLMNGEAQLILELDP